MATLCTYMYFIYPSTSHLLSFIISNSDKHEFSSIWKWMSCSNYVMNHVDADSDHTEVKCSSVDESIFLRAENNMSSGNFSLVVFKGLLPHFHENLGLCVKCLIYRRKDNSLKYQFHFHNDLNNE